jgi:hypothetical protein
MIKALAQSLEFSEPVLIIVFSLSFISTAFLNIKLFKKLSSLLKTTSIIWWTLFLVLFFFSINNSEKDINLLGIELIFFSSFFLCLFPIKIGIKNFKRPLEELLSKKGFLFFLLFAGNFFFTILSFIIFMTSMSRITTDYFMGIITIMDELSWLFILIIVSCFLFTSIKSKRNNEDDNKKTTFIKVALKTIFLSSAISIVAMSAIDFFRIILEL